MIFLPALLPLSLSLYVFPVFRLSPFSLSLPFSPCPPTLCPPFLSTLLISPYQAERIEALELHLVVGDNPPVIVRTLDGLRDHCVPSAPAALLKAGVLALDLIALRSLREIGGGSSGSSSSSLLSLSSRTGSAIKFASLKDQLHQNIGSGLRVRTWSNLPQGSGMGTSSILAGAMLFAMAQASGKPFADDASLMHSVLVLEQVRSFLLFFFSSFLLFFFSSFLLFFFLLFLLLFYYFT